jgi:hypothetical protein
MCDYRKCALALSIVLVVAIVDHRGYCDCCDEVNPIGHHGDSPLSIGSSSATRATSSPARTSAASDPCDR